MEGDDEKQNGKGRKKIGRKVGKTGSKTKKIKGEIAEEEVEANKEEKKNVEDEEKNNECDKNTTVEEAVELEDDRIQEQNNRQEIDLFGKYGEGQMSSFDPPQEEAFESLQTIPNFPDSFRTGCQEKPKLQEMLVREVVSQWVGAASVTSASEAIRLVAPGKGKLFNMIMENVGERWKAAEHQNAVLGGGKHEAELSAAVSSARKEGDAKVRAECDRTIAMLRSQLAEANNREEQAKENHQKVLEDTRLRVMAAFPTEGSISRRGCLCNMFFRKAIL